MKQCFVRVAAFLALAAYAPGVLFAGDYAQSVLNGRRALEFYLERAQIQTSAERFKEISEQGLQGAVLEWERSAEGLKLAGLEDYYSQKKEFEQSAKERSEEVFAQWLLEKKKSEAEDIKKSALYAELRSLSESFFYVGQDGRETRIVSREQIQEARAQWEAAAEKAVQAHLESAASDWAADGAWRVEREIVNQLADSLLYDHDSLKKMSDSQAALFIADGLASKIESESARSMDALFNSLETEAAFVDAGDVQAKADAEKKWLSDFERELRFGLSRWSEAEEEFLSARAEWEKDAEKVYLNDSQKWQEAYNELQERKAAWSEKIALQIESGKKEWQGKFSVLEKEIQESMFEFQNELAWETEQRRQIVSNQEAVYVQSRAILESAQVGVDAWYERWGEKYKGLYSYWKTEDNSFGARRDLSLVSSVQLKNEIQSWKKDFAQSLKKIVSHSCSENSSAQEIGAACQRALQRKGRANGVPEAYWSLVKEGYSAWAASEELFEWLDVYDRFSERAREALFALYGDSCANIEITDELSSEKAKAKSLVEYWQARVKIAEAVRDYAQNDLSDLEWADETERNLESAFARYKAAKDEYQALFDNAEVLRLELLEAREGYFEAAALADALLAKAQGEREIYDEIYERKIEFYKSISADAILDLVFDLQSMNISSQEFSGRLYSYCAAAQERFEKNLSEEIERARNAAENGFDESGALGREFKELGQNEMVRDAASDQSLFDSSPSRLSLAGLEALDEAALDILSSAVFDAEKTRGILPDFYKVDKEKAALLEEALSVFDESPGAGREARDIFKELESLARREAENRKAILLLLDGSAEEIREFFDGNEEFRESYDGYKGLSRALLAEQNAAALLEIQKIISSGYDGGIDGYAARLDEAAFGLSAFFASALEAYKAALKSRADCAAVEESVKAGLSDFRSSLGELRFDDVDWFCEELEGFFLAGGAAAPADDFDESAFLKIAFGRKALFAELQGRLSELSAASERLERLQSELSAQAEAVQSAQREYEKSLDGISAALPESFLSRYIDSCGRYNELLLECQARYEELERTKRDWRLSEEIYFYAQNEYLHGAYDADAKVSECQEKLARFQNALAALEAIEQDGPGEVLDQYKESYAQYYKARVMLFEYDRRVEAQTERLFQAQTLEREKAARLVREAGGNGADIDVPASARDLVAATVGEDGRYSFALNAARVPLGEENERALKNYYSDYCVSEIDVYKNERLSTRAKTDALAFLESLSEKPYSIADLALSAMHLKSLGSAGQKALWFKGGEDPSVKANYKIGDLPESVHGYNAANSYRDERMCLVREAYDRTIALGGEEDIARYILFCDTNICQGLDFYNIGRNSLIVSAMENPMNSVRRNADNWNRSAEVFFGIAAVFASIACLPFGIGAWAAGLASAAAATGGALKLVANQIYEYLSDMKGVRNGALANLRASLGEWEGAFSEWREAKKDREAQTEALNLLLSGKKALDGKKLSWEDFKTAVQESFDPGSLGVGSSYFMDLSDSASGAGGLRSFFEELSAEEDFYDARSAIEKMARVLQTDSEAKKDALESAVKSRDGYLSFDRASYCKDLLSFYSKDVLQSLPSAMNRKCEDYMSDVFADYAAAAEEAFLYSARNRTRQKEDGFSLLSGDMGEQYSLWEEKIAAVLNSAQIEWAGAEEKISLSRSLWQKNFNDEYQSAGREWSENYRAFLKEKGDWIFDQYMGTAAAPAASLPLVKRIKAAFDSDERIESVVDSFCDARKFERFSDLAQNLSSFAKNYGGERALLDKADLSLIKNYDEALKAQKDLQKTQAALAAKSAAQYWRACLEQSLSGYFDSIQEQNAGIERWELNMVREAGYSVDPLIHRNAIVDVSVFSTSRREQRVHRYEYFSPDAPAVDFDASSYSGTDEFFIMKKVEEAQERIQAWAAEIFGSAKRSAAEGRLSEHIGRAPAFIQKVDPSASRERNVKDPGSGEVGKILLDFQWNSIVSSNAAADLAKPIYDQKLFDTGDFQLPSLRDIAGIVLDVVANATGIVALQFVDDVVFGAIDIGMGYKSWGDVLQGVAKQGMMAGIASGVKAIGSAAAGAIQKSAKAFQSGAGSQIFGGFQRAAEGYATSVAQGYLNAFDFVSGKMDWEAAASSWTNALSSAAGTAVGGSLGAFNNVDANGTALNQNLFGSVRAMNSTIGSLAGQGLNYLLTGDFSVNLLNVNGRGLFELGVKDGRFRAGYGNGGTDLSCGTISTLVQGAKTASKVSGLKNAGEHSRAILNASNNLAWSGLPENLSLASDLFNGKRGLSFEENPAIEFGRTEGNSIVLNRALLSQGKEGQALIAALASFQNFVGAEIYDEFDFSDAAKNDGSAVSEEAIEIARRFAESQSAIHAMSAAGLSYSSALALLGLDGDSPDGKAARALKLWADAYEKGGVADVYALYAEAVKEAKENEKEITGLAQLAEQPYFQNEEKNRDILLGFSFEKNEYNKIARQRAIDRYVAKRLNEEGKRKKNYVYEGDLKRIEREARAKAEAEIVEGVANKKYGYDPEKDSLDIESYGCTLSTVAYIAYSITGKITTLAEANEIIKKNDLFVENTDDNDVRQKNWVGRGKGYAAAVNAIAGGSYLQMDGDEKSFSVDASVKKNGRWADNRKAIFERILDNSESQSDVYFTHLRVNNTHSVLLKSLEFKGEEKNYKNSFLSVMDPWRDGTYGPKSWADISRADFYKLTQSGKDVYNLTRRALRTAA